MSFCLYCLYLTARLAGKLLFGPLRLIESEVGGSRDDDAAQPDSLGVNFCSTCKSTAG